MEKIKINLNPKKEDKIEQFFDKAVEFNSSLVLVLIVIILITAVLQLVVFSKGGRYRALMREWKQWEEKNAVISRLKSEKAALEQERDMIQGGLVPFKVAKILDAIYASLPSNIWFSSIEYRSEKLFIKGKVVRLQEDAMLSLGDKFIKPLKENKNFSAFFREINIKNTRKTTYQGVDVLEFELECLR